MIRTALITFLSLFSTVVFALQTDGTTAGLVEDLNNIQGKFIISSIDIHGLSTLSRDQPNDKKLKGSCDKLIKSDFVSGRDARPLNSEEYNVYELSNNAKNSCENLNFNLVFFDTIDLPQNTIVLRLGQMNSLLDTTLSSWAMPKCIKYQIKSWIPSSTLKVKLNCNLYNKNNAFVGQIEFIEK